MTNSDLVFSRRVSNTGQAPSLNANPPTSNGFTLVELLVVVGIIVGLLAILIPSLDKALATANRTKCTTNLQEIGKAVTLSLTDSLSQKLPKTTNWFALLGKSGTIEAYNTKDQDIEDRPLNKYLGITGEGRFTKGPMGLADDTVDSGITPEVPVAECPSDKGMELHDANGDNSVFGDNTITTSAYHQTGSSYISAFATHTGIDAAFGATPRLQTDLNPPHKKILAGDGPLYRENVYATGARNRWHSSDKQKRIFNILFADSHVEFFDFTTRQGVVNIETLPVHVPATPTAGLHTRGYW